ncbi:MAG: SMI1/KNR4 family protein [Bacteroidota bacterium]
MVVNNLKLPSKLVQLAKKGQWPPVLNQNNFAKISYSSYAEEMKFANIEEIIGLTKDLILISKMPQGKYYGLTSDFVGDKKIDGLLRVDKAIVIAYNSEEEFVCLDYSENDECPMVSMNAWVVNECRWVVFANSFDEFLEKIA